MSTATQRILVPELRSYLQAWADTLTHIVTEVSGTPTTCELVQELTTDKPGLDNSLFVRGAVSGPVAGVFWFGVPSSTIDQLLSHQKAEAGSGPWNQTESLRRVFERAAEQVSTAVGVKHALQEVCGSRPADLEAAQSYWFRLNSPAASLLELQMDSGCAAALAAKTPVHMAVPAREATTTVGAVGSPEEKLEVLKHVELAVSMRFGGRRMLLKDILDLSAGSVVELDQQIQQPVDLLLDGRLIARGEVVVVDGNYGLRVTEVVADATR